jgi:putative DNA primase/helicase
MNFAFDLRSMARTLNGHVVGGEVLAPGRGHSQRDRSLSVRLSASSPDGFIVHSFAGEDWRDCQDYVRERLGLPSAWKPDRRTPSPKSSRLADPGEEARHEQRRAYVAQLISELQSVRGTIGETYLREPRRIDTQAIADVLNSIDAIGWHPAVRFNEVGHALHGQRLGCIVAIMSDPLTAKPTGGISRTYLTADGSKVDKAKGLGPAGVVRLSRDEDVLAGLFVAEGLETALAGMSIGALPMWSTGSTSIMANLPVVSGIEAITIIADNDANGAGERAPRQLNERWFRAGRETMVLVPETQGDLNDLLMGRLR